MKKIEEPPVSILFINWNGLEDSIECIKSCLKIDYSNYNVLLYDNGSSENEAKKLKKIFKNKKIYLSCVPKKIGDTTGAAMKQ